MKKKDIQDKYHNYFLRAGLDFAVVNQVAVLGMIKRCRQSQEYIFLAIRLKTH